MKRSLFVIGMLAAVLAMGIIGCKQPTDTPKTIAVTGVTLDKEEITLFEEDTYTLTATIEPSTASNKSVSWESDDKDVATVSNTGVVTAVAVGTATIKVTTADGKFTKECAVTVKPLPVSIEVTKSPTTIKIGEPLDLAEIEVTATYSDDSEDEAEITLENITGFNPNTAGKQTVTVTYAELTDTFDVWVLALSKIEVSLIGDLSHILIGQGEEIDLEDITVTATWKNESDNEHVITEAVTITMENLSAFDRTKADTHTVTVTYGGKTDTFEVLVLGVTSISVTTPPDKTTYKIGEQLDLAGLEILVTFSDGETEPVHHDAVHTTGFDSSTLGEKTITVTYGGHSDTFTAKVVSVVTFNPNGGNWEGDTDNKIVELDTITTVTKPSSDPTQAWQNFAGWYTQSGESFNFSTPITADITLYAHWEFTNTSDVALYLDSQPANDINSSYTIVMNVSSTAGIANVITNSGKYVSLDLSGSTLTSIGESAFRDCTNLTSITIPNGVTSIVNMAFRDCTNLASVTIPNSVTSIGSQAFYRCRSLASITIPDSVTSIESGAFSDCRSLASITIPDSVTSIESSAFSDCTSLTSIIIPDSVTSIGISAFQGCTSLESVTIPDSVTSIGSQAFYRCRSLASITIPDSVTSIGEQAFSSCTNLTAITVAEDNANYSSEDGIVYNKAKTTLIAYPAGKTGSSYTIPDSVTSIGNSAFYGCTSLESITIPNDVTSIGESAFRDCTSLESVTIPDSVTNIGQQAFTNCTSLESVTIPNSVTSIGSSVFYSCGRLATIICHAEEPPTMGTSVFYFTHTSLVIKVPAGSVEAYKTAENWSAYASRIVAIE